MTSHDDQIRSLLATYERSLNTSDAALAAVLLHPRRHLHAHHAAHRRGRRHGRRLPADLRRDPPRRDLRDRRTRRHQRPQRVRTDSQHGTQTVLATGDQTAESNREIFLFRHTDAGWKIARDMFNKPA